MPMKPIVQISLDLTNIDEALETAAMALRAGVDWLEAGTPLILAEGLHGVRKLGEAFPGIPIVADLKTMYGGTLEADMMAKAGATHVVVMARAHAETIKCVVKAGKDFGVQVMGDNMMIYPMIATRKMFLLPNFAAILPLKGIMVIWPSGNISRILPNAPSERCRLALISGILLAQLPKHNPMAKKYNPNAPLAFHFG